MFKATEAAPVAGAQVRKGFPLDNRAPTASGDVFCSLLRNGCSDEVVKVAEAPGTTEARHGGLSGSGDRLTLWFSELHQDTSNRGNHGK